MRYPVAQVAPLLLVPCVGMVAAALLLDEHPTPAVAGLRPGAARLSGASAGRQNAAVQGPGRGLTLAGGKLPMMVKALWARSPIPAGRHHQESKDMRHPHPSVIPSLSRAMGLMAIVLPLCWSPFGWSATPAGRPQMGEQRHRPRLCRPRGQAGGTFRDFMSSFPLTLRKIRARTPTAVLPVMSMRPTCRS